MTVFISVYILFCVFNLMMLPSLYRHYKLYGDGSFAEKIVMFVFPFTSFFIWIPGVYMVIKKHLYK